MPLFGEIAALATALLWSGSSLLFASATGRVGSFHVNITRLVLASGLLGLALMVIRPEVSLAPVQVGLLAASGVVGLAIGDSFLFRAYREQGARLTMLVMSLAPAFSALLSYWFLGEEISLTGAMGIAVTIAGIGMVVLQRSPGAERPGWTLSGGMAYSLIAAAGQGGGLVLAKMAFSHSPVDGFLAALVRILASIVILAPLLLLRARWRETAGRFRRDRRALLLTAGGSVLGPFLGISLSLIAVMHTSVGVAATLMATVPVMMLPIARYVFQEKLTRRAILGAVVAVAGVAMLFLR
jgi:drug/metabolite transporter (DMT)-like permease